MKKSTAAQQRKHAPESAARIQVRFARQVMRDLALRAAGGDTIAAALLLAQVAPQGPAAAVAQALVGALVQDDAEALRDLDAVARKALRRPLLRVYANFVAPRATKAHAGRLAMEYLARLAGLSTHGATLANAFAVMYARELAEVMSNAGVPVTGDVAELAGCLLRCSNKPDRERGAVALFEACGLTAQQAHACVNDAARARDRRNCQES